MFDLDAYCDRIGYAGPRSPTLATLRALHALHPAAIPFENLDPLLGRPVPLDLAALQRKLVAGRRGGYCFEQNSLFHAALEALGFAPVGLAARVLWTARPDGSPNPRTHMLLRLALEGESCIADVGFGGLLLGAPLRLVPEIEQDVPGGPMRFRQSGGEFTLQAWREQGWRDLYRFTLEPQLPVDCEMANWFTSTHPGSLFRRSLLVERLMPEVRLSLVNRKLTRRHADGRVEQEVLASPAALGQALTREFGLEPPAPAEAIFGRLPRA
jgi:N-hydroxyarylamine O-acetyltransferase